MARMIVRLRGPLVSATLGPCAGLWARRHRLRCTGGRMGKRTPCAANEGEMCCGPTIYSVAIALPHQPFFKPCCSLGGGFSHTHTTGHHVCCPVRVVLQPTRGRVVGDCEWTGIVKWRPPVKQASGSEGAISVCSRGVNPEAACLRSGRRGLATAICKGMGNVD